MRYLKMNGAGNDFVILDARSRGSLPLSAEQARAIADRETGIGCDQVIAVERSIRGDAFMRIWGAPSRRIETGAGMLYAERKGPKTISVDMGSPLLRWEEIPIAKAMETAKLDYEAGGLTSPGAVNMGNPHVVFFVHDVRTVPIETLGPRIERDPFFPQGVNAGFAEVRSTDQIRLRVWERGTGVTKACGTGACAAVVAAHRQGRTGREVEVLVDGGVLNIEWRAGDDRVIMTGPIELEGSGDLPSAAA